jgi:hypothetical protein
MLTVQDIMGMEPFLNAKVIGGEAGLGNVVKQVSIADTPPTETDYVVARRGDFCLSNFYYAKDNIESIFTFMETLYNTGASGVCLVDEYITELPTEIRAYCDSVQLPVLLVDKNIPYADMITAIMERVIITQQQVIVDNKLLTLISTQLDNFQKSKLLADLNPHFLNYITTFYVIQQNEDLIVDFKKQQNLVDSLNRNILVFASIYKGGVLVLSSHKDSGKGVIPESHEYILGEINSTLPRSIIGVSSPGNLLDCGAIIMQAITAAKSKGPSDSNVAYYRNLGVVRLLSLLSGHLELVQFCEDILGPIFRHDQKNDGQLFSTMVCFLDNGRDYKKTAKSLFVHENTVRYRIAKSYELLETEIHEDDFLESVSIAIKIHRMLGNN